MQKKRIAQALVVVAVGTALAAPGGVVWGQNRPVTNVQYDANGNLTSTTDAFGRATQQNYDALNRLTRVTQPKPSPSEPNPVTKFSVDGLDQLTSVTDARNLVTSYSVSGLGNLTQQVSPDTGTTINTFDAAGNLKTSQDARGKKTTYYYDGINRLTRALYADGTNSYFYYDENANGVGRLTRMVDPGTVTTRWTYTTQGRVASKSQALSAGGATRTHTVLYGYNDTTGQLTSMTYPSGRVIGYAYGAASKEIETVTVDGQPVASSVAYHPFGGIKSMRLHNGLAWASTLDQDGRMTSYTLGGVVYSIAWDSANRITAITHATTPYWSRGYAYDGLDRIASFVSEPRDQIFSYDAVGNLLTKTDRVGTNDPVGYTYNISPTSNRMTGIGSMGIGYAVDAAGNRTADSTTTWVVNARGRVSQVRVISGATTYTYSYLINGQNLRVRKTGPSSVVPQGTQVFVYDEGGRLLGEYDNYGRARNEHVWLADRPVALIVYTYSGTSATPLTTTVYSVEADHLGTPRLITDSAQAQRWSWHSAPYGDTQPNQNPASKGTLVYNLRFPGQYYDKETNNFYNWHRDYESTTGRYVQSDPIGLAGGVNTYAYVKGLPVSRIDPRGLLDMWFPESDPGSGITNAYSPAPFNGFGDYGHGFGSYYRGLWNAGVHMYRRAGYAGQCYQRRAVQNEYALGGALYALSQPLVFQYASDAAGSWASRNKAYIAGRLSAGALTSTLLGVGVPGGVSFGFVAGTGDALHNIDRADASSAEQVLRSVLGDPMLELPEVIREDCSCPR